MLDMGISTREAAVGIWLAVLSLVLFARREVRASLSVVLRSATAPVLLLPFAVLAAYIAAVVLGLSQLGLWTASLLKDTILWFILAGVSFAFRFGIARGDNGVVRQWLRDSIAIAIVLELLLARYTLPLALEFVLIPVFVFLAMIGVAGERDPKYRRVTSASATVQGVLILPILAFVAVSVVRDFSNLTTADALRELLLAPFLSVAILPFAYALRVFVSYDNLIRRVGWRRRRSPGTLIYAAVRLLGYLGPRHARVQSFIHRNGLRLGDLQTRSELDELIRDDRQESLRKAA